MRHTRGDGLLESFLARQRAWRANRLIPGELRGGRILDIGCGTYPYFLAHTAFVEKFGVDQIPIDQKIAADLQIELYHLDLDSRPSLPFESDFFSVVTLLAVIEHIDPHNMAILFGDIYRVLQKRGRVILTTPAAWSSGLLRLMARLNLVSKAEIDEHIYAYTLPLLGWYFGRAGFAMDKVRFGYFEFGLNLWATAEK
ncbi:MAG: class I SAM-dependent methyltransferase [Anaerolineales bacterium]